MSTSCAAVCAPRAPTTMQRYLLGHGGRDTLHFKDPTEAVEAARCLRARHPEIEVSASYERVILSIPKPKE